MQKCILFSLYLLLGCGMAEAADAQTSVVSFFVTIPNEGFVPGSEVYIAGSFNHWNPKDEKFKMSRIDASNWSRTTHKEETVEMKQYWMLTLNNGELMPLWQRN